MESENIVTLCASLSISEREHDGPIQRLDVNLKTAAMHRMSLCVVGKILSKKKVNREAFMRVIGRIWQVDRGMDFESATGNMFTFHFKDENDMSRVISGELWSFDDALIAMEKLQGMGTIESMDFNWAEFWVQIHQVSLLCMSKEIGRFLCGMIGDGMAVDGGNAGDCVGNFIRVRVHVDIKKPLKRSLRVDVLGDGNEKVMVLRYKRLSDHCFKCGMVDHATNECIDNDPIPVVNGDEKFPFGGATINIFVATIGVLATQSINILFPSLKIYYRTNKFIT